MQIAAPNKQFIVCKEHVSIGRKNGIICEPEKSMTNGRESRVKNPDRVPGVLVCKYCTLLAL